MDASLDPAYTLLTQEPWCCIPACVQMILLRRDVPAEIQGQEGIGNELGLVVPPDYADCFSSVRTSPEPPDGYAGWGTRIDRPEFSIEAYLARHSLPLACAFTPPSGIGDIREYLLEHLLAGDDILVCFRYRHLYGIREAGECGHGSLIQALRGGSVVLADPHGLYREVPLERFFKAVNVHPSGGFWVVSSTED